MVLGIPLNPVGLSALKVKKKPEDNTPKMSPAIEPNLPKVASDPRTAGISSPTAIDALNKGFGVNPKTNEIIDVPESSMPLWERVANKSVPLDAGNSELKALQQKQKMEMLSQANSARLQPILSQIGNVGMPEPNIGGFGSSAGSAVGDIAANVATKAGAGALVGGLATGGVGALGGAGAGAVYGLATAWNEIKQEELYKKDIAYQDFAGANKRLKAIILNAKTQDPLDAIRLYNKVIAGVHQAESNLKLLEKRDGLTKVKPQLKEIQQFYDMQPMYDKLLADALAKNPNADYSFLEEPVANE